MSNSSSDEFKIDKKDVDRLKADQKAGSEPQKEKTPASVVVRRVVIVAVVVVYFALLLFGKYFLPEDGVLLGSLNVFSGEEAPNRLLRIASLIIVTLSISAILRWFIGRMADNRKLTKRTGVAVIELLGNLVKYVAYIVLIFLVLSALGVDTTELVAGLGILSLIIGLGVTSLIEDIVAGIFIIAEHTFDVGDIIVVNGFRGTVVSIGIRSTQIEDTGTDILIMRNSSIGSLVNLTDRASSAGVIIPLSPQESLAHAEEVIRDAHIENLKEKLPDIVGGPFYLGPNDTTSKGVQKLLFIARCKEDVKYSVQRSLRRELSLLFEQNGIQIGSPDIVDDD